MAPRSAGLIPRLVVSGTDTGIGKTIFSAGLVHLLHGAYWKPVQAGLDGETDSQVVARLAGVGGARLLPEAYRLATPASPHRAAELDGVAIDTAALQPPASPGPLVIEGAGGLLVPLSADVLFVDVFARWNLPVVLCARTGLGTLNHTLLSVEALHRRGVPLLGIALIGDAHADNERTLGRLSGSPILGRLPRLAEVTPAALHAAFGAAFRREDFVPG